jgi:hypothetical protein
MTYQQLHGIRLNFNFKGMKMENNTEVQTKEVMSEMYKDAISKKEALEKENESLKNNMNFLNVRIAVLNDELNRSLNLNHELKVGNIIVQGQLKALQDIKKE